MKVLVAGATGFLGSHIIETFLNAGHHIIIIKRSTSSEWRIKAFLPSIKAYDLDKCELDYIFADSKPDIVINCVCNYGRGNSELINVIEANLNFGIRLVQASISNNVKAFLNTGTLLPKNVNPYSLSKHQLVEWLKLSSSKIQIVNLRIEHMIGTRDDESKFIYWLIAQLKNEDLKERIKLTSGVQLRDFIDVEDVSNAYLLVCSKLQSLGSFTELDVASGNLLSIREFVEKVAYQLDNKDYRKLLEKIEFGALPYRENDVMEPIIDNRELLSIGWELNYSVEDSISKILKN